MEMSFRIVMLRFWFTCEDLHDNLYYRLGWFGNDSWYPSAKYERFPKKLLKPGKFIPLEVKR
jgi:hypothetical protein